MTAHSPTHILGPHAPHADLASFAATVAVWQLMMIVMMTPAVLRWMLTLVELTASAGGVGRAHVLAAFASGYFVVWLVFSAAGAGVQIALQQAGLDPVGGLGRVAAGAILAAAGAIQFSPMRRACLSHCRNPLTYLLARWENGPPGGFRIGIEHGAYCVGCCWALMSTGFALGVMNVAWMAALTAVIAAEQWLPAGERVGQAAGITFLAWGAALAAGWI